MANILAVGIAALDIINTTNAYPQEDEEVRAVSQATRRGGNATNSLVVLSQLGHHCYWLGSLADDASATFIKNELDSFGVNYEKCEVHRSSVSPTSYITLNSQNGSRTIVHYRDLPEMSAKTFTNFNFDTIDWIHFEGRNIDQTTEMFSHLKKLNSIVPVSVEIEKQRDNLQNLFNEADIYFFSKAFAESENFTDAEALLQHYRNLMPESILICSWGSEGAFALDKQQLHFAAAPAVKVVDSIGAGDTFNAAFIHARLDGNSVKKCLEFACELAAKKCSIQGFNGII